MNETEYAVRFESLETLIKNNYTNTIETITKLEKNLDDRIDKLDQKIEKYEDMTLLIDREVITIKAEKEHLKDELREFKQQEKDYGITIDDRIDKLKYLPWKFLSVQLIVLSIIFALMRVLLKH